MEPYPSGQFGFIDDPDRQFGSSLVWTRIWTRSDGLEPLLTLCKRLRTARAVFTFVMKRVSNRSGEPADSPYSNHKNNLVRFRTHPGTQPGTGWNAKPGPKPVNPQDFPAIARPVSSDLQFRFSGIATYGHIDVSNC